MEYYWLLFENYENKSKKNIRKIPNYNKQYKNCRAELKIKTSKKILIKTNNILHPFKKINK